MVEAFPQCLRTLKHNSDVKLPVLVTRAALDGAVSRVVTADAWQPGRVRPVSNSNRC